MSTFSIINAVNVTCEFTLMKIVKTHFEVLVFFYFFIFRSYTFILRHYILILLFSYKFRPSVRAR